MSNTPPPSQPNPYPPADRPNIGQPQQFTQDLFPGPSARSPKRHVLIPALTGLLGIVIGASVTFGIMQASSGSGQNAAGSPGSGSAASPAASPSTPSDILKRTVEACDSPEGVEVSDGGTTLTFDNKGNDDYSGAEISDLSCIFTFLDMPSRITTHMDQTTSMDGRQSATWEKYEVQWSYHPDRGLDGMIVLTE